MLHDFKAFLPVLAGLYLSGCVHDRLDIPCPDIGPDDLVVTEIHGPQTGEDRYGEWIEVYNPTGRSVDLSGLKINFIKLDGSSTTSVLVRRPVQIEPDSYAVFGRQVLGAEPSYVDYGYINDMDSKIFDTAAVELSACGEVVDVAVYRNLPSRGSLVLSGDISPPTAEANDDERLWCVDALEDENTEQFGIRGTPQEENPTCPE